MNTLAKVLAFTALAGAVAAPLAAEAQIRHFGPGHAVYVGHGWRGYGWHGYGWRGPGWGGWGWGPGYYPPAPIVYGPPEPPVYEEPPPPPPLPPPGPAVYEAPPPLRPFPVVHHRFVRPVHHVVRRVVVCHTVTRPVAKRA